MVIRLHSIIYKVIEEGGMLDPEFEEKSHQGKQLHSETFKVSKWVPMVDLWSLVVRLRDSKVRVIS